MKFLGTMIFWLQQLKMFFHKIILMVAFFLILEGGYFFQLKSCWRKRKVCLLAAASAGLAQELFFKSCLRFKLKSDTGKMHAWTESC